MARTFVLNCWHTTPELSQMAKHFGPKAVTMPSTIGQLALSLSDGHVAGVKANNGGTTVANYRFD